MSTIWTDLLFLHGHVAPTDLPWRKDALPDQRERGTSLKLRPAQNDVPAPPARPSHGDAPACA